VSEPRPRRPVPLPPEVVAEVADVTIDATPEAELLERLDSALRLLPAAERRAVLTAHADAEGVAGVAAALDLSAEEAEALTRSAVQLLRGALSDLEPDAAPAYGSPTPNPSAAAPRAE
jgi:DNA-directed RNA polymerase specialized sigma24 family protein